MAFETPTHIDQEKRPDHPEGAITANTEADASDTQSVLDDAEVASVTPLVDEALEAVREQSDAEDSSAYASEEVEAIDSVSALTVASGRVVKAEAKGVAATFDARIRAQPIAYLGLGAIVGYLLGRRF